MKKTMVLFMLISMFGVCPINASATANQTTNQVASEIIANDETGIPDKGLYQAILRVLEKKDSETFTKEEAESLTVLDDYNSPYEVKWYPDVKNLKGIGYLKNLRRIQLQDHALETLEGVEELKNLESIAIYTSQIKTLKPLETCTSLKELVINSSKISSLEGIDKLTNLETLTMTNSKLKSLKGIETLKNLKVLNVSHNKLTKVNEVAKLTKLESLNLSYNQLKKLPNMTKLKKLEHTKYDGHGLIVTHNKLSEKEIRSKFPKKLLKGGGKAKKAWLKKQIGLQNINCTLKLTTPGSLNKITTKTTKIKGKTLPNVKVSFFVEKYGDYMGYTTSDKNGYFEMDLLSLKNSAGLKGKIEIQIKCPGTNEWETIQKDYSFIIKNK